MQARAERLDANRTIRCVMRLQAKLRTIDVTRRNHAKASRRAAAACRRNLRPPQGMRREAWVRRFVRARWALQASARLISAGLLTAPGMQRAQRRPMEASRQLQAASGCLFTASGWLSRAAHEIAATNECIALDPANALDAPELLLEFAEDFLFVAEWLDEAMKRIATRQRDVFHGLETGQLVPERAAGRPRIILAPRPVPVRAFLAARDPRAADRISPVLHRRRRTPRPAAVSVPRRSTQGRAPPLSPVCPF